MQDQVFQSAVQVVGLCETVATGCAVDDAVLHLAVHTTDRNMRSHYQVDSASESDLRQK